MKMKFLAIPVLSLCLLAISCSSKKSAASVAQKWCDLNGKVARAEEGKEKEGAMADRKKYEEEMQEKYKNDEAFMKEVGVEVEKCEGASEGRK